MAALPKIGNDNNYPASPVDEALKQTKVSMRQFEEEIGFEVSVPTNAEVEQSIPPAEHWPFAWIDVYTGEGLRRKTLALAGYNLGGGASAMYSQDEPAVIALDDKDIKRLEDIASLRVRQTTATGSPGTCEIVLQNALEPTIDKSGNLVWERVDFRPGRFFDGQNIRYMSQTPINGNYWYKGTLKEIKSYTMPYTVELDGRYFNVVWDTYGAPPEIYDGVSISIAESDRVTGTLPASFYEKEFGIHKEQENEEDFAQVISRSAVTVLPAGRFYAEDAGEPLFEPMQKIKIYSVNRFQPNILEQFGYRTLNTVGAVASTQGANTGIEDAGASEFPHATNINGEGITDSESLQFTGGPAFQYASPIFTGYISDVTNQQQGANWEIRIQARDVTVWLDYSMLNINPAVVPGTEFPPALIGGFQIYSIRFESMPSDEIIRAIFLGLETANIVLSTKIYKDCNMTIPLTTSVVDPNSGSPITKDIILPVGAIVYIHDRYPRLGDEPKDYQKKVIDILQGSPPDSPFTSFIAYKVGTNFGIEGWIPVWLDSEGNPVTLPTRQPNKSAAITIPRRSYTGLGFFVEEADNSYPVIAVGAAKSQTIQSYDKLTIYSAIEPYNENEDSAKDRYVVRAYQQYLRQNWPLFESDFATRRSIVNNVCKLSNCECYADGDGKIWFHPVWAYHSVKNPAYILQQEECVSWAFTFSDREIVTWSQATGEYMFNLIHGEWMYGLAIETRAMCEKYGIRGLNIQNPNVTSSGAAITYALSVMNRINSNKITGSVSVILRPELQLANNVYIPWLNMVGYISSIDHAIQWGQQAVTTIGLKYVRHPWERWMPLEYFEEEGRDQWEKDRQGTGFDIVNPWQELSKIPTGVTKDPINQSTSSVRPSEVGNTQKVKVPTGEMSAPGAKYNVIASNNLFAPLRPRTQSAMDNDSTHVTAPKDNITQVGSSQQGVAKRDVVMKYLNTILLTPCRLVPVPAVQAKANRYAVLSKNSECNISIASAFCTAGFTYIQTRVSGEDSILIFDWNE